MSADVLRRCLESEDEARTLFRSWHLHNFDRARSNLAHFVQSLGIQAVAELFHPLSRLLPRCADADMAFNNLERFFGNPAGTAQLPAVLEGRGRTLETLLNLFGSSQFFSDLLIANPDYLEMLRVPLRSSPSRAEMIEQ